MTRMIRKLYQINESNDTSYLVKTKFKTFEPFSSYITLFNSNLWVQGNGTCSVRPFENENTFMYIIFNVAHYGPEVY